VRARKQQITPKAVFDTNIVIDSFKQIPAALAELKQCVSPHISIITCIELLAGARDYAEERIIRKHFLRFTVIPLNESVADIAAVFRRTLGLKLPDAVILASAEYLDLELVTRNSKDFEAVSPRVKIPYRLH
jgi:predicted nucleic acid-binding protein